MSLDERAAVTALVSDLQWQVDQLKPRGIKDKAGNPYTASYYKRGLKGAVAKGGTAVVEFVRSYLYKPPSDGFKKLEEKNSLDLACEALVADAAKPYAHLFSDEDREAAQKRLGPHLEAIAARKNPTAEIAALPDDLEQLRKLAQDDPTPQAALAINSKIVQLDPEDAIAAIRLGRAHQDLHHDEEAVQAFERVLELDPKNPIATRRLEILRFRRPS
jgi:tetratricopeptide (TPR) repeat protein